VTGVQIVGNLFEIFFKAFVQYNCEYDHTLHRFQCPCDGRSFGGMPGMNYFVGDNDPYYSMHPIDYEGFPVINDELRYAKCLFEVVNSTSTNYPNSYVFGRTFLSKFNAAFEIDRTGGEGNLSMKISLHK
jgi:hypothetical protein